ncbi:MAG: virulence factor TspB C-terminal domain-related protein, partial [Oscillospiraceae bacterium]
GGNASCNPEIEDCDCDERVDDCDGNSSGKVGDAEKLSLDFDDDYDLTDKFDDFFTTNTCPSDLEIDGYSFSYEYICTFLAYLKPLIFVVSFISAFFIILV